MGLSSLGGVEKDSEGVVYIDGRESNGDYSEILDRKTGTLLAHKIYRQGFAQPKSAAQGKAGSGFRRGGRGGG